MAKINKFIASYTDILEELEIPMGEGLPPKAVIRRFLRIFKTVDDSRIQAMIDYPACFPRCSRQCLNLDRDGMFREEKTAMAQKISPLKKWHSVP